MMILWVEWIVIIEDKYGFQKGMVYSGKNGFVCFWQKLEGKDEYMEGEVEWIEYNSNSEIVELFECVWVKSGEDQVCGDYIWYDVISEKYLVMVGKLCDLKVILVCVCVVIQLKNKIGEVGQLVICGEGVEFKGVKDMKVLV